MLSFEVVGIQIWIVEIWFIRPNHLTLLKSEGSKNEICLLHQAQSNGITLTLMERFLKMHIVNIFWTFPLTQNFNGQSMYQISYINIHGH